MTERLWRTLVGSHAFGVAHAGSDYDLFDCYAVDTEDLLSGRVAAGGCHVGETVWEDGKTKTDVQSHEISRWVDGALDGNLNYMIGILSPLPLDDPRGLLYQLRELVYANRSTAMVRSTLGMARSNFKKMRMHIASGDERRAVKNLRTSMRSIALARRFMQGARGHDLFLPLEGMNAPLDKLTIRLTLDMELLEEDAERSGLPPRPNPEPFRDYLLSIRLRILRG